MRFIQLKKLNKNALFFSLFLILSGSVQANVLGTDAQNFVPATDGIDFVTVQSAQTLRPGYLNFGLFLNYAANTLPVLQGRGSNYSDSLLSSDMNLGVGIAKDWDAGISVPALLHQNVRDEAFIGGNFSQTGITEVRMNTKYRLIGDDAQGVALIGTVNFGLIEENPYAGNGAGPTFNLEAAYNRRFGDVDAAINLGHRWRQPGTPLAGVPILPLHNQWIASTAASYLVESWDTKFILEIFGAIPQQSTDQSGDNQQTVFEGLLAAKHDFSSNLAGQLGIGRKLEAGGIASPSFRVYVGMNYAWGALWGKESKSEQIPLEKAEVFTSVAELPSEENPEPLAVKNEDHYVTHVLQFATNSSELSEEDAAGVLDHLTETLNASPYQKLVIGGHTDSIGNARYNQKLSLRRAQTIRKILISRYKVDPKKIKAVGYGKTKPIASNGNFQGREQNRRVEFKIIR